MFYEAVAFTVIHTRIPVEDLIAGSVGLNPGEPIM
jgi:hypothetical protein